MKLAVKVMVLVINMKNFFVALSIFGLLVATPVFGQDLLTDLNKQNQAFAGQKGANLSDADPRIVAAKIVKILLSVTGVALTAWTFYGGLLIFTAAGDSEKIDRAKSVISNGVIGLILVLSAYSITWFVYRLWYKAINPMDSYFIFWKDEPSPDFYPNGDPYSGTNNKPL